MQIKSPNKIDHVYSSESFFAKSPALIFFFIALTVFAAEAAVMLSLHLLPPQSTLVEALMDASLLVILISPALYFFLFQPMVAHIREREKIEERLHRNEEEQFKVMIRASLDGFLITDMHGNFIEVNDAYCKMTGYTRAELLSMHITDVDAIETAEETARHVGRIVEIGSDCFETNQRCRDGRTLCVEVSANYSNIRGGQIYCFLRDITGRKQAERALYEAKESAEQALQKLHVSTQSLRVLSRAIEQSPVMNVITDVNGVIEYVNPKFYQLTGYSAAEVIGENPRILNSGSQSKDFYAELWATITSGQEWRGEMCNKKKNGELFWENASISPVRNEYGEITQFIASKEDITERKLAEEELKLCAQMLNSISDTVFLLDLEGNFIYLNEAAWKTRGYTQQEMMGMNLRELNAPEQNILFASRINTLLERGCGSFESEHRCKNGTLMPVEINARIIESGGHRLLLGVIRDATERKRMEIALQESEEKFRSMSTYTQDALIMMNDEGKISFWNAAAEKIFGYAALEVMGRELHTFIAPERYYDAFKKVYGHFRETGEGEMIGKTRELMAIKKDGVEFPIELSLSALKLKGKWHGVGVVRDITERKLAEERMHYLAYYDALTGMANRTLFADRLHQSLITAKRDKAHLAVMFLDLDQFKPVNDDLGHDIGDLLLKEAANRMHNCVRESDTVSRIGGDEFMILLPSVEVGQDAMRVAEKILHALNQPFEFAGHSIHISASIGIAVYPEHGSEAKLLTRNADIAMYHAKSDGRNNVQLYRAEMVVA